MKRYLNLLLPHYCLTGVTSILTFIFLLLGSCKREEQIALKQLRISVSRATVFLKKPNNIVLTEGSEQAMKSQVLN
ncbi:hypothetical protein SAMN05421820_10268 [Pedobacter steynii]|uniref:Uncharacterized protein n=1 Tax=Pedobacter steynii TaxID=430522 RepID=A0A1G9MN59_9SPHI|nr:hypothetical protein SAMN05421820_10268 [Pedobacter steynii]